MMSDMDINSLIDRYFRDRTFGVDVMATVQRNPSILNSVGRFDTTLLSLAVLGGDSSLTTSLLLAGADPNLPIGNSSLVTAIKTRQANRLDIVRILLEHGADPNCRSDVYATAIHAAVGESCTDIVRLLLEYGARINELGDDGMTPLWAACMWRDPEMVKLLLEHGADFNLRNSTLGTSPIEEAIRNGNQEIIQLLVTAGAIVP
jgi:uncharacterized protein